MCVRNREDHARGQKAIAGASDGRGHWPAGVSEYRPPFGLAFRAEAGIEPGELGGDSADDGPNTAQIG